MRTGGTTVLAALAIAPALSVNAATAPSALAQAQPGLWEISGAPGSNTPIRQCVSEVTALARFEHRAIACSARVLRGAASVTAIDYSCGGAGFGHSEVEVITPRSLRISTQGISGGLPFNYVIQAHRLDDCPKISVPNGH